MFRAWEEGGKCGVGGGEGMGEICNTFNNKNVFLKVCTYGNPGHGQIVYIFHSVDTVKSTDIRKGMR